jgi:fructose/tagatose bisphosphate aldolase
LWRPRASILSPSLSATCTARTQCQSSSTSTYSRKIAAAVPHVHLSLHGGSGTPEEEFRGAVARGINKVNINSDMRRAYRDTLEKVLADNPKEYAVVKLMSGVIEAVQAVVEAKIDSFGSAGKAASAGKSAD